MMFAGKSPPLVIDGKIAVKCVVNATLIVKKGVDIEGKIELISKSSDVEVMDYKIEKARG
ncbi:MAG: hypothetical protein ACFFDT_22665 [Candidatus Hodarchaeota archaeon]